MRKLIIISAIVAAIVVAAYLKGRYDNEARHIRAALNEAQGDAAVADRLAAVEEANRMLNRAMEDQAYAEPVNDGCGLPLSRVLRLRDR